MVIYRSSDSLSRCDVNPYSTLYDVRKRPDIKHDPAASTRPAQRDTIEISRDQLNEEALIRLRHVSKYVIAQEGFMRIGKYLFLAVALPPYFFLYGLPKWLLVEGLPAIYTISVWMMKKIHHQMKKRMEVVNQKVSQMVHFVQSLAKILMQPIIQMALQIRQSFTRIKERLIAPFKNFTRKIKSAFRFSGLNFTKSQSLKNLKRSFLAIKEKLSEGREKLGTIIQQSVQWMKESPQVLLGWGQLQLQRITEEALTFTGKWKKTFEPSQKIATQTTDWVFNQFTKGKEALKKRFAPLVNNYLKKWLPRWQMIKGGCQKQWDQASDFFKHRYQRAWIFLYSQEEKLKFLSSDQIIDYINSHVWLNKFPMFFQKYLKKWLLYPFTRTLLETGVNFSSFFVKALLQIAKWSLELFARIGTLFKKTGYWLKTSFKSGSDILKVLLKTMRKCAFYTFYYFLLFSTMSFILFAWGLRFLGDCTKDCIAKIFLFKPKNSSSR